MTLELTRRRLARLTGIFLIGAVGYPLLELLWRGRTHALMSVAGGISLLAVYAVTALPRRTGVFVKCLIGAAAITATELCIGLVANLRLGLGIWDYSHRPLNFLGQICVLYSFLWFLLCVPLVLICGRLRRAFARADRELWM